MGPVERSASCKDFEADLVLFHYGELDNTERDALETHLQNCVPCRDALHDLAKLMPLTVERDRPPDAFWHDYSRELRKKIDSLSERRSWLREFGAWLRPLPLAALGACAVMILALTVTVGKKYWSVPETVDDEVLTMMSSRQDLDLLKNLEILDALDVLEAMSPENDKV